MDRKCVDLVFESDLNNFDLKDSDLSHALSPVIKQKEPPIGIYRVLYKNGRPISSYIKKLSLA